MPLPTIPERTAGYLSTLRRLSDDAVLELATREFSMFNPQRCICGWALRQDMAKAASNGTRYTAEDILLNPSEVNINLQLAVLHGGTPEEWADIFSGVTDNYRYPYIELAFVLRLDEAVTESRTEDAVTLATWDGHLEVG